MTMGQPFPSEVTATARKCPDGFVPIYIGGRLWFREARLYEQDIADGRLSPSCRVQVET